MTDTTDYTAAQLETLIRDDDWERHVRAHGRWLQLGLSTPIGEPLTAQEAADAARMRELRRLELSETNERFERRHAAVRAQFAPPPLSGPGWAQAWANGPGREEDDYGDDSGGSMSGGPGG